MQCCNGRHPSACARARDVQKLLGFANFSRRFTKDFSEPAHPLVVLTRKGTRRDWRTVQGQAFERLESAFTTEPVLARPDPPSQAVCGGSGRLQRRRWRHSVARRSHLRPWIPLCVYETKWGVR